MIARHVAHAIATGLNRMHLDLSERRQNIGRIFEPGTVELKVLSGAEVAPPLIPTLGNITERPELAPRECSVGNGNPQHGRMTLDIEAILKPQRAKFVFGQLAGQEASSLVAVTRDAVVHDALIVLVVLVHGDRRIEVPQPSSVRCFASQGNQFDLLYSLPKSI